MAIRVECQDCTWFASSSPTNPSSYVKFAANGHSKAYNHTYVVYGSEEEE
ncbi:MAG: hypothetical protein H6797_03400 [Candidatus Nomurabacteria bacterium]|nr:MAG: hypothetical protein H6797_03400 [Candidatus Nomurabacteria bacterium]